MQERMIDFYAWVQVWGYDLVMPAPPSSGAVVLLALHILQGKHICNFATPSSDSAKLHSLGCHVMCLYNLAGILQGLVKGVT